MPGGIITNLTNLTSHNAINHPQYTLIALILTFVLLILADRLFGLNVYIVVSILLLIFSVIIASTLTNADKPFNALFNSSSSKNFMSVFLLVFFIIFVYENPDYDNDNPHPLYVKIGMPFITTKMVAMSLILSFSLVTAYTIYLTTRE